MFLPIPGEDLRNSSSLEDLYESQLLLLSELCLLPGQLNPGLDGAFRVINSVLGLVSILLLVLTLLVYALLPELHNLHGYLVTSNILANILQTAFLLLVFNLSHWLGDLACKILGYLGYFLTMAMFAWMTVLSIDLAWTLNRSRSGLPDLPLYLSSSASSFFLHFRIPGASSSRARVLGYTSLAWGLSAVLTLLLVIIDLDLLQLRETLSLQQPRVGLHTCFVDPELHGVYLHYPVGGLLLLNALSFLGTFISLRRSAGLS